MRTSIFFPLGIGVAVALSAAWAAAVQPGQWTHQTEADFADAETEDTVVTSLGEVQLARATEPVAELNGDDSIVYDLARLDDGRVFLAIGPEGKLARLDGDQVKPVQAYEDAQVFALAATEAGLWVAVSGATSRLELRGGDEMAVQRTVELPGVRYVWDVLKVGQQLWLATGTEGKVLVLAENTPGAEPVAALDSPQDNVLCLGADGRGRIYAGTDGEGLVYRITPGDDESFDTFVLYDAQEPEIGALLVQRDGTVYAGTADAEQAKPGRLEKAEEEPTGRPERQPEEVREPEIPQVPPKPEPREEPQPQDRAEGRGAEGSRRPDARQEPDEGDAQAAARPTTEQYERLRQEVRRRLDEAAESGRIPLQAAGDTASATAARLRSRVSGAGRSRPGAAGNGNAIYRINSDGFVREVFRESVMILRLLTTGEGLLAATGNEGQLYHVDPETEEVTILADLESQQAPALLTQNDGDVLVGTANPGRLIRLSNRYAGDGTLRSEPLDASQISLWGKLQIMAAAPEGTAVEVQTRSGNMGDPEVGSWSAWSEALTPSFTNGTSAYLPIASPAARFLQYRLRLRSDGQATPTVHRVSLKYLMPNLRPRITSIKAEYTQPSSRSSGGGDESEAPRPRTTLKVEWEAEDANKDKLRYKLEARAFGTAEPFVTIADELDETSHEWDTRRAADGRYVLRVTASDAPDNVPEQALTAARLSDPVVVDNTPPDIEELTLRPDEAGAARLAARVVDALSPIAEVRYAVDGDKDWRYILPEDLIYDSTSELIGVTITDLSAGTRVLSIRATDALGNSRYVSRTIDIPRP